MEELILRIGFHGTFLSLNVRIFSYGNHSLMAHQIQ